MHKMIKPGMMFTTTATTLIRACSPCSFLIQDVPMRLVVMQHHRLVSTRLFQSEGGSEKVNFVKRYKINGTGVGSAVKMETNTGHVLDTDVPIKMGGKDSAPQPVEHLLAALIGCTQATAVYVGRMMKPRLIIDKIDFNLEGIRDERGALQLPIEELPVIPARLECVTGVVKLYFKKGVVPSKDQLRILKEQTEARCPVANMMIASGCKMDVNWIDGD